MNPNLNREHEYNKMLAEMAETPPEMTQMSSKTKARARKHRFARRLLAIPSTALALLLALTAVVNISPAAAHALEGLPVLGQIAAAFNFSPTLQTAIEHDFAQHIGLEQTIGGITARIEYVIVDRWRLNIFYTLSSDVYDGILSNTQIQWHDDDVGIRPTHSANRAAHEINEPRVLTIDFRDNDTPDVLIVEIQATAACDLPLADSTLLMNELATRIDENTLEITATFSFELEIDPTFLAHGETIVLDYEFVIDGQMITLTTLDIYPSIMRVNFIADPSNTARAMELDMYVVNERGEVFGMSSMGLQAILVVSPAGGLPTEMMFTMESPFFYDSEHLTLYIQYVEWLDKDIQRLRINLSDYTANIQLPEGVVMLEPRREGEDWYLAFEVPPTMSGNRRVAFFMTYFDEAGNRGTTTPSGFFGRPDRDYFVQHMILRDFSGDIVYLVPTFTRTVQLDEPVAIPLR